VRREVRAWRLFRPIHVHRTRSHALAAEYYERACALARTAHVVNAADTNAANNGNYDCTAATHPLHVILARLADMYKGGEWGLERNLSKAGRVGRARAPAHTCAQLNCTRRRPRRRRRR